MIIKETDGTSAECDRRDQSVLADALAEDLATLANYDGIDGHELGDEKIRLGDVAEHIEAAIGWLQKHARRTPR